MKAFGKAAATAALLLAAAAMSHSCQKAETAEDLGLPRMEASPESLTFDASGGNQTISLTATRDWTATVESKDEYGNPWLAIDQTAGTASTAARTISVTALSNTGLDREGSVVFSNKYGECTIKVLQTGLGSKIIYKNDFDKAVLPEKTKEDLNGESWHNETGSAAGTVTYKWNQTDERLATSTSAMSDVNCDPSYASSSGNNIFFTSSSSYCPRWLQIDGLGLYESVRSYTLSFGYYGNNGGAKLQKSFYVYLSADGKTWTQLPVSADATDYYWIPISCSFSLDSSVKELHIRFQAYAPSYKYTYGYRIDDVCLEISDNADAPALDLSKGVEIGDDSPDDPDPDPDPVNPDPVDPDPDDPDDPDPVDPTPTDVQKVSIAEFIGMADSDEIWYEVSGTVSSVNSAQEGFYLSDGTNEIYVYYCTNFSDYSIGTGDQITVVGHRYTYNETAEMTKGQITAWTAYVPTGTYSSNVKWPSGTNSTNAWYAYSATVNGEANVQVLKLGKGGTAGVCTLTLPSKEVKKLSFYGLSWKGSSNTVTFKLGGEAVFEQKLNGHDGVSGNSKTYTLDGVDESNCYSFSLEGLDLSKELTVCSSERIVIFAVNAE